MDGSLRVLQLNHLLQKRRNSKWTCFLLKLNDSIRLGRAHFMKEVTSWSEVKVNKNYNGTAALFWKYSLASLVMMSNWDETKLFLSFV